VENHRYLNNFFEENKTFFFMSGRKHGILIPDLYLYSIKIQTGIDKNEVKIGGKSHIFK
jgi:hypothetical protein